MSADVASHEDVAEVVLGVVAAPGAPTELARTLVPDLTEDLSSHAPGVRWRVEQVEDSLVTPPADDAELVAAARETLLDQGWDLVVCLTDLPLRVDRRSVVAHASPVQGVAVVSAPALGVLGTRKRARQTVLRLIDGLLGAPACPEPGTPEEPEWQHRRALRLRALGEDVGGEGAFGFTTKVLTGNLSLLVGMVWANRPWRLTVGLSRALVAALAAGVFALITPDVWELADASGGWRLGIVGVGSVVGIVATVIIGAGLWERSRQPRVRQQVLLFNVATTATVVLGVLFFYLGLLVVSLLATLLLVVPDLLAGTLEHPVGFVDYAKLAWLSTSLATAGGALGAGLETDEAVREAAYLHRSDLTTEEQPA